MISNPFSIVAVVGLFAIVSLLSISQIGETTLNKGAVKPQLSNHQHRQLKVHFPLLSKNDPRSVQLKEHHILHPSLKQRSAMLRKFLSPEELEAIGKFGRALRGSHCCPSDEALMNLNTYVHSHFTLEERVKWMNPSRGVLRSLNAESNIPCQESAAYWVQPGSWQAVPMWSHCCNQGTAIAKCPSHVMQTPSRCSPSTSLTGTPHHPPCESDGTLLCREFMRHEKYQDCLVYTFGIANQWDFEDWVGSLGCEVHAHDPTTSYLERHRRHKSDANVQFHYMGLATPGGTAGNFRSNGYGDLGGEMMTLGDLWKRHGHAQQNRRISILKIDCEGCEWEAFHELAIQEPEVISNVCTIIVEFHVSETLQMATAAQLKLMASFWQHYIEKFGFRFWYLHENTGAHFDQRVNPLLLDAGIMLDPTVCCYEMALRRADCGIHSTPPTEQTQPTATTAQH